MTDPAEVFLTMRLFRALRAIYEQRGAPYVREALEQAEFELRFRAADIRDARDGGPSDIGLVRRVQSLTGSSRQTVASAYMATMEPSRHAVAVEVIEAYALDLGVSLKQRAGVTA